MEYTDKGQDEPSLQIKIKELLAVGKHYVWVVRLGGPQWVEVYTEVYTRDSPMRRIVLPGEISCNEKDMKTWRRFCRKVLEKAEPRDCWREQRKARPRV